jgi:type IV pilus assembly protein PilQ
MTYQLKALALFWTVACFVCLGRESFGQEDYPREVRPDELISLDRSLSMKTALDILSQYSMRHENKLIIDPSGVAKGNINVMVNNMHWRRALEYILRSNLMKFEEREKYYEVVPLTKSSESASPSEFITTGSREVEINAVFFDADYGTLLEAGVDWRIDNGRVRVSGNFGSQVTRDLFSVRLNDRFRMWDIFGLLRTFETLDKGEVLANPQIKVLDGQEGKIKVGTNFFLTTQDFAGNLRFTEYEAGVILTVTPQVIGAGDSLFVHLDILAERSTVFPDAVNTTKNITESRTQVLLLNGEETVIAGLFSNELVEGRRGIPILKDLPPWFFGLRYLFGYNFKQTKKKELIIILQASVVPTIAERVAMRQGQKNLIEQKRLEFMRKLRQLKTANSANGRAPSGAATRRR